MLNHEQTQILEQAIVLLFRLRDDQSVENWEVQREREFAKTYKPYGEVQESILKKSLIQEVKDLLIQLNIEGSVRERKNGLLEFRNIDFGSVYGRSVKEFETKLLEKIKALCNANKRKSAVTFSEFFYENYLPYKKETLKDSSISGIESDFKFLVDNGFDRPINRFTTEYIEKFLYSIPTTRKRQKVRGVINNILKYAKRIGKIKTNPCDNVEKVKHTSKNGQALSFAMQEKFFDNVFSSKLTLDKKLYLVYVYLTGSRRKEALDVTASDFDLNTNTLHIPGTKTDGSDRIVPLIPRVKKLFNCMAEFRDIKSGTFFNLTMSQIDHLMRLGIKGYHLHDLRHTYGTLAVCVKKYDPKTVSMFMGHTDISMTLKTYTHPEQLDRGIFYDGSKSDNEKLELMRAKYQGILDKIEAFLDEHTQNLPKK